MKIFRIFAVAAVALSLAACSDDSREVNTNGNVTVSMQNAEVFTKEGRGTIKLPIDIKGERNGDIKLTLAVKSEYENPAIDDVNMYLTTKEIVIYPEDNVYNVEVTIVDDKDMNESRYCDVAIVSAEGATIGNPSFTKIEIKDNDSEPYDRCAGDWYINIIDDSGASSKMLINLSSFDEGHGGYKNYYVVNNVLSNLVGDGLSLRAYFTYDEETKTGTVTFPYGYGMGEIDLGGKYGVQSFTFYEGILENDRFMINENGGSVFDYNDTFTAMTVQPSELTGTYPLWTFTFGNSVLEFFYVTAMERPAN